MTNRAIRILDSQTRVGRGVCMIGLVAFLGVALVLTPGAGRPLANASTDALAKDSVPDTAVVSEMKHAGSGDHSAPNSERPNPNSPKVSLQDELATILVRVVDVHGLPIEGANIHAGYWTDDPEYRKKNNVDIPTDTAGEATVEIYPQLRIFRLWASKSGYVSVFFNWEKGETNSIPTEYQVLLQPGIELGGVVVDSNGKPIAGAKVDVSRESGGAKVDPQTRVKLDTWLANGADMAVTDESGKWSINNAPEGDDLQLRFLIEHPDFINDTSRQSMGHYKVTLEQLKSGTAKFNMAKGVPIRGKITDAEGNPIANGLVIWGDRPYMEQGSQEVEIGEDGEFQVPPQPPGETRITVAAPGWMPADRVVSIVAGEETAQNFELKPGKRLQLKFVDPEGNPIPKVYVGIDEWHGQEALYNYRHSNVKDTTIPINSDERGIYLWDWAPDDLIKLSFSVRDWKYSQSEFEVVATGEPQTIVLSKPFVLSGNVVNGETGEAVNQYSIVPVTYSSDSNTARGIAQRSWQKTYDSTNFSFDEAFQYDDGRLVAFRFQAIGFRDLTTERFSADTPAIVTTIRLGPTSIRSVRIRKRGGEACTDAKVWVAKPDQGTMINRFKDYFSGMERGFDADLSGEVQYGAPGTPHAIVVASNDGYAEKYLDVEEEPGELTLRPWAKLEGRLFQAGEPVSGANVIVQPIRQLGGDHPHVQDIFQTTTDANGRFVFQNLPPVPSVVRSILSPWRDYPITSSRELPIDLQPGKSHEVSLGGEGIQVIGKVKLLGGNADQIQFCYGLNSLMRMDGGIPTPEHAIGGRVFEAGEAKTWNERLIAGLEPNITRESFFVKIRNDGSFLISGVQPGRYRFLIKLYEPPTGCLVEPVGYGFLEFSTDDYPASDAELDLGTIEVALKPIPRVGDVLPDFRFQDLDNSRHQISEYRGKHVLIDFWASWCQPCIKAFPDLARIHDSVASRDDVAIISLSVDEELGAAKTVALREQLSWAVGFAGKSAGEGSSANALGVSTVPTYLVLDPQGKILYRGFSHEEAAKFLPAGDE